MVYNGDKIMCLWKGKKEDKKEDRDDFHEPNPAGPALNNSCGKAVKLKVKFEEFGYPMYFPSCVPESFSILQKSVHNFILTTYDLISTTYIHV